MAPASSLRRFWLFAHIGVMVSLLFGTVHPVQPGISARGTSGRASLGSRFDSWSEAATVGHDEAEVSPDDRRTSAMAGETSDAQPTNPAWAPAVSLPVFVSPLAVASVLPIAGDLAVHGRCVAASSDRAPPRA
jgi:hypothetical protein